MFPILIQSSHGFDEMKHMLCYYAGVYGYRDPELHPWFPNWDSKFVEMYSKLVNDGEYEGVAGQPAKHIKEHFGYADLATIDDEQAASAATSRPRRAVTPALTTGGLSHTRTSL
jgi:hypothetical protein